MSPKRLLLVATVAALPAVVLAEGPIQSEPTVTSLDYIERLCSSFQFKNTAVDSQAMSESERSQLMVSLVCEISKAMLQQMPPNAPVESQR